MRAKSADQPLCMTYLLDLDRVPRSFVLDVILDLSTSDRVRQINWPKTSASLTNFNLNSFSSNQSQYVDFDNVWTNTDHNNECAIGYSPNG